MRKIVIYIGPKQAFLSTLPENAEYQTLARLALRSDARQRQHVFKIQGKKKPEEPEDALQRLAAPLVVAFSDDYAAITESAIQGFLAFLSQFDINALYLQNPPAYIMDQLLKSGADIEVVRYYYDAVDASFLLKFNDHYESRILGQEKVKQQLMTALYPLSRSKQAKPAVILFYGPTGSGKTETAKFIAETLNQPLFRKQFSMFQNEGFASYLFGGKHSQISLARELMERESNVLLFDEFDKPNALFHSAFYQLFDEGIYCDRNYYVELHGAIIVCTSNYKSPEEAMHKLGAPLFSRFDAVIPFAALSEETNRAIIQKEYHRQFQQLNAEEKKAVSQRVVLSNLLEEATNLCSARHVKRAAKNAISAALLDALLNGEF